jgi:hypothetical protein
VAASGGSDRALGAGDCEAWRGTGRLGQPTNAVTSLAFVAAGAWLVARTRLVRPEERWRAGAYGAALAASGIGSVAFHGRGGPVSHWLHDVSLASLLAALPVEQLASVRGWGSRPALTLWGLATLPAGVHLAIDPDASVPSTGVLVTAATLGEVHRATLAPPPTATATRAGAGSGVVGSGDAARRRSRTAFAALALGVLSYVLGRTDAPTCRPHARWQWHGAWHVLGAVAAAAWSDRVHVLPYREGPAR